MNFFESKVRTHDLKPELFANSLRIVSFLKGYPYLFIYLFLLHPNENEACATK